MPNVVSAGSSTSRPTRLWLGERAGEPPVELIDLSTMDRLPIPADGDGGHGLSGAVARAGWVALKLGRQTLALPDDDVLSPTRLPDAFQVAPAADPRLLVASAAVVPSVSGEIRMSYLLVAADGEITRVVDGPVSNVAGELSGGTVVAQDGLLAWDGTTSALPVNGAAIAVLGGRRIIALDGGMLRCHDTEDSSEVTCELPGATGAVVADVAYDTAASSVALRVIDIGVDVDEFVVATATVRLRRMSIGESARSLLWRDADHLIVVGQRRVVVVNVETGASDDLDAIPRGARPRLDVTGHFDPDQLRRVARPPWKGPIPEQRQRELRAKALERVVDAAGRVGLSDRVAASGVSAIRIRSFPPPSRLAVGASRLGGRPDLPKGSRWPTLNRVPMAFLCQMHFEELSAAAPDLDLPGDGLLVVFAGLDPESQAPLGVHVEVVPKDGLARANWPAGLDGALRYEPAVALAEPAISVPDWPVLARTEPTDAVERFVKLMRSPGPRHQLFGHPSTNQGTDEPDGYEVLLQFDSDALVGAQFADGGRLLVFYPSGAALAGTVENCLLWLDTD